jgi:hypothetical protein
MSTQARVKQLEKQAGQNKAASPLKSWRDFIEWCNGVLKFDADTEAKLQKEYADFIAKDKPTVKP